jgi:two-component system response regulator TctD
MSTERALINSSNNLVKRAPRILLVDDDPGVGTFIEELMLNAGYLFDRAGSAFEARRVLAEEGPAVNLILLDIGLPDKNGWEVLRNQRMGGDQTPVIFLSAQYALADRIRGLELGADDFIQKPFRPEELLARIRAVLRRHEMLPSYRVGPLSLDLSHQTANVAGRRIDVSPREFQVLLALARAHGGICSRAQLLKEVWELDSDPGTKLLEVQITRLRSKLAPEGQGLIQTVIGQGYRIGWSPMAS